MIYMRQCLVSLYCVANRCWNLFERIFPLRILHMVRFVISVSVSKKKVKVKVRSVGT